MYRQLGGIFRVVATQSTLRVVQTCKITGEGPRTEFRVPTIRALADPPTTTGASRSTASWIFTAVK